MELWFILFLSLCLCAAFKSFLSISSHGKAKQTKLSLPPGPPKVVIICNFLWFYKYFSDIGTSFIHNFHLKYGPVVTLNIASQPAIYIATHSLAHQALIKSGAAFADRPPCTESGKIFTSNQHNISSAAYGPLWRVLRRNLISEILHHSRVKNYSHVRKWVLQILKKRLNSHVGSGKPVLVMEDFQYMIFSLLVFICIGDKLDEKLISEIEDVERKLFDLFHTFNVLEFFPSFGKIFYRNRWQQLLEMRKREDSIIIPIIRARKERKSQNPDDEFFFVSYVDTMFNLEIPDDDEGGMRKLTEQEMVTLCSEFLNAGTDTTSTALQWIMANLVKHQETQEKLYSEIKRVTEEGREVKEEDLMKMPYLKAVVLEGLRLHPPVHIVVPHSVTEDLVFDGHIIPKNATVNFMVAQMGRDPKVWKDPMEFKPERFLLGGHDDQRVVFDMTGSREIKMMPFGVGRRICPGLSLGVLHLEYFVANMIRDFKWTAVEGVGVDLSEKQEFTVVMKKPLQAYISPRMN